MSKRMKATGFGRLHAHIYSVLCMPCTHACAFSYLYLADSRMTTSLAEAYQTVRLATADDLYGNTNITRHSTFTEVIRSKSESLSSSINSVKEHNRHLNLKNSVLGDRIQLGLCLLTLENTIKCILYLAVGRDQPVDGRGCSRFPTGEHSIFECVTHNPARGETGEHAAAQDEFAHFLHG
jgi:hypothetical protein